MGCRWLRNFKHLIDTSKDGQWVNAGEFPLALGSYTSVPKAPRGKRLDRLCDRYLDVVHLDVAFGDCVSLGGSRYALIFADRATRHSWVFSLKSLSADHILECFKLFRSEAGAYAAEYRCDCDEKLFGSAIRSFLHSHGSKIIAAPSGRHSSNGFVESHWKTMVHMSRAYLTENQMPRKYWFYAVKHAARMMNMIPGKFRGKLASSFMLVHGVKPDQRMWIPIFSVCYFHHTKDGDDKRSHTQAHTLDGIIVGRSSTSNAILVYNPRTKRYYEPYTYRVDRIGFHARCTPLFPTTTACSVPSFGTTTLQLRSLSLQERGSRTLIPTPRSYGRARSWTFPWTLRPRLNISLCLMMAPPNLFQQSICLPSFPKLLKPLRTRPSLPSLPSYVTTPRLPTSTTASITRDSFSGRPMDSVSAVAVMSTRIRRTGVCPFPTSFILGLSSVPRPSSSQGTILTVSFDRLPPPAHLIPG
ncbi:hypothetical protein ACHAWF_004419 [Thalassiosira exigua]